MNGGTYIRGKVPLTASLAVGFVFSEGFGLRFRVEQPVSGDGQRFLANGFGERNMLLSFLVEYL